MKTQIVLPDELGAELKRIVPQRKRSRFIAEAIEKRLRVIRFQTTLKETAGAWSDKNHPDLKTQADINRYLARLRGCHHK